MKGRKRHTVTDTMGNLLAIDVHAANVHDTKAGINAAKKPPRNTPQSKDFVLMPDTAKLLFLSSL